VRRALAATPVIFGSHRRPEGVLLPFALFEQLLPHIEDIMLGDLVAARLADSAASSPLAGLVAELGFLPNEFE
jgi:hypothetical protein